MAEHFVNLVDLYVKSCKKFESRPLFGTKKNGAWSFITYGDFAREVDRFRAGLRTLGVGRGDRVAIVSDNCVEWAVAAYATYGLEAAFVPMYQAQRSEERRFILEDCGARVVIVATSALYDDVATMRLPSVEHVIGFTRPPADTDSWDALMAVSASAPVPASSPAPDTIANFIYTSGTTGKPKGVILSHGNIVSNVNGIHAIFTFEPDDRSLAFLPWAHAFGQTVEVHALLSMGCSVAINDRLDNLIANLAEVKPTILVAVPRVFNRIYERVNAEIAERPDYVQRIIRTGIGGAKKRARGERLGALERLDLALDETLVFSKIKERFGGKLRYAISGSATLGREVAEFIDAIGLVVCEGYGLTETSPIVTANVPATRRLGSVGRVIPGVRIVIDKTVTGDPKQGEIVVYGPNVMQGYHNRPEETALALTSDGGLRTGDLGHLDAGGFLYITGRIKEQYKLENGKYVMPAPLEGELMLSPYVTNVMLYGDGRPFNVALVVLDVAAVRAWADVEGIALGSDLTKHPRVRLLIEHEIELHAESFKAFERPRDFVLVADDFTTENGMLTPTLKVRRRDVVARYGQRLEELYRKRALTGAA
jgi:long-chain acyl-CoA synthetase